VDSQHQLQTRCATESTLASNSWAVESQHHLQTRCAVDSQYYIQTVRPWRVSATFKQGVRWTVTTALKQVGHGQSALHSNTWAVDSQHYKQMGNGQHPLQTKCAVDSQHYIHTVGPWTVNTTFSWAVDRQHHLHTRCAVDGQHCIQTVGRWTVSATFKHLGRGQSALPSKSWAVDRQHQLQTRCAVDSHHYTQTGVPWIVSTTFKQLGRGQTAPPSNKVCCGQHYIQRVGTCTVSTTCKQMAVDSQHHLQTRCAVDSQHYIQTDGQRRLSAPFK
jgi:hypothetical protein